MSQGNEDQVTRKSVLAFECQKKWDKLKQQDKDGRVKFCDECNKNVFLSLSDFEFKQNSELGRCVAISTTKDVLYENVFEQKITLGMPLEHVYVGWEEQEEILKKNRSARRKTLVGTSAIAIAALVLIAQLL